MITMLRTGFEKIMRIFYADKNAKLHLREIARKTGLHEPSTTRVLRELEKEGILKSEKDGNQKKYFIRHNYKTYSVFELFDLERLNKLPNIRKNAIIYFLNEVREKPIISFVFGSTAKGTFKQDSDIDLLLITNSKIDTRQAEKTAEALTGIRISVFQLPLNEFMKEIKLKQEQVIQAAITTGYPVTNNIYYYGALYEKQLFA